MLRKPRTEPLQMVKNGSEIIWESGGMLQTVKEEWSATWCDQRRGEETPTVQRFYQSFGEGSLAQQKAPIERQTLEVHPIERTKKSEKKYYKVNADELFRCLLLNQCHEGVNVLF